MFESFITFTEVVKLSSNVFNEMKTINYHDKLLDLIYIREDIFTFEQIADLVENKYLVTKLIQILQKDPSKQERWLKGIFKFIDYIDIAAFDNSLLIYSCLYRFIDFVKCLIEKGVDIHFRDDIIFRHAAQTNYFELVKYLLKKGANIHTDNDYALRTASFHGHLEIVKYLIERPDCEICKGNCRHTANIHAEGNRAIKCAAKKVILRLLNICYRGMQMNPLSKSII